MASKIAGSSLGPEATVVRRQLDRFADRHPDVRVELRVTPDAADQRHQLYVQWLNARSPAPDVLQLDVVWTAEFAAAGWIRQLDRFAPDVTDFVPAALQASRWRDALYALPWFVDVGLLYWRTDLLHSAPTSLTALDDLDVSTELERRPGVGCSVAADAETARVFFMGETIRTPPRAARALEFIASHARFRIADIDPSLSDDSKLVLARRLIKEGLLQVARPLES